MTNFWWALRDLNSRVPFRRSCSTGRRLHPLGQGPLLPNLSSVTHGQGRLILSTIRTRPVLKITNVVELAAHRAPLSVGHRAVDDYCLFDLRLRRTRPVGVAIIDPEVALHLMGLHGDQLRELDKALLLKGKNVAARRRDL